jgi:ubiquinone/menaquinone biosynthesis C-methylase UbiE
MQLYKTRNKIETITGRMFVMAWLRRGDIDNERRTPGLLVRMKGRVTHRGFRTKRAESDLRSLGLKEGFTVLDFGCGTGVYTIAAARIVGENGLVHAVDLHPTSLEMVEKKAGELGLGNIETIYSDLETGADPGSVDAVIFYNVLRGSKKASALLSEAHRIIKPKGILLVRQARMSNHRIIDILIKDSLFRYVGTHGKTLKFGKIEGAFHEI